MFDNIKSKIPSRLITPVPDGLKGQFDQVQLKESVRRLKYVAVVLGFFRLNSLILYFISGGRIVDSNRLTQLLYSDAKIYFPSSVFHLAENILFFILVSYFSKKEKRPVLWAICYFFVLVNFSHNIEIMAVARYDIQVLFIFFLTLLLNIHIPNFRPRAFIGAAVFFYAATIGAMIYNPSFSREGDTQLFVFAAFTAVLTLKILHYNSNVKVFIEMKEIDALNEKLAALSITDELTKLNNRRSFSGYMDIIWKQSHRLKLPLSVIMIDIDFFKKYNDAMGHLEGDNVLAAVAQCMKNQLKRDTDFIARFGGEEFVCLLPYIEKEKAADFAEELVKSVENLKIRHPMNESSKYITISAGMASIVPDENTSPKQLLDEADKALYTAKQSGRNKVVIS